MAGREAIEREVAGMPDAILSLSREVDGAVRGVDPSDPGTSSLRCAMALGRVGVLARKLSRLEGEARERGCSDLTLGILAQAQGTLAIEHKTLEGLKDALDTASDAAKLQHEQKRAALEITAAIAEIRRGETGRQPQSDGAGRQGRQA